MKNTAPSRTSRRLARALGLPIFLVALGSNPGTLSAQDQTKAPAFQVPDGFVVEPVAGQPLVEHPMFACFDDRGRLLVADSLGIKLTTREDLGHLSATSLEIPNIPRLREAIKNPPMQIRRLEDTDGDGRFDKSTVFADKLIFPQGALWHDGALYVVSPPSLWRIEDTDGDGVADKRQELVTGLTLNGAADDSHGPVLGPDGRLYWCQGRYAHEVRRPGAAELIAKGLGPRIYRCRLDGSEVEMLSAAMGNPVETAFSAEGEAFACGTFFFRGDTGSNGSLRDAMIHAVEGGVYPVRGRGDTERHRTGELLPALVSMSLVSPSGLMRYRSGAFGADYRDNLLMASFNLHSIQRHIVERDGATFRTRQSDFFVWKSPDFRPTDVLEDADGSLLVVDTGDWFDQCPTAGRGLRAVDGGIYRIRRKDAAVPQDARGSKLDWAGMKPEQLAPLLDDARFVVRDRAVHELGKHGAAALPVLRKGLGNPATVQARQNALWVLARIEGNEARAAARVALADEESSVQLTAANVVGLHRDAGAQPALLNLLTTGSAPVRREAATALGRIRRAEAVPALFEGLRAGGDRFLEHALTYALIRIDDRAAILKGLADSSPRVRRGALIALDQMDHGDLTQDLVTPLLNTDDPALQKAALAVITARKWGNQIAGLLGTWLAQDAAPAESLRGVVLGFSKDAAIQKLVAEALGKEKTPIATRLLLLETIASAPLDRLPATWVQALGHSLADADERVVRHAVAAIQTGRVTDFDEALVRLAGDGKKAADVRVAALTAAAARLPRIEPALFEFVLPRLDKEMPPLDRLAAAGALGIARLSDAQLEALTARVTDLGTLELPHLLATFERSKNPAVGHKLVAALDKSPGLQSLSPVVLRATLKAYPPEVGEAAAPLLKRIEVDTEKQKARLAELEPVLTGGDIARGRAVFFGKKAVCAACHTVGSEGGQVGPDLSKIGAARSGRDLLEAIVFPSASLAREYEPFSITTTAGKAYFGVVRQQTAEAISMVMADRTETRIPRSEIKEFTPVLLSLMPQGLDAQLSPQELGDLIAYLVSLK